MAKRYQKQNSGVQASRARMFPLLERANGKDFADGIPASSMISQDCLMTIARLLSFSKTFQVFFLPTVEEISESFSARWTNSGMVWLGVCLTADSSASPSRAEDSTLLDIVETRPEQPHYYLSPNAAEGILRRADTQGRNLFPPLRKALETLASAQSSRSLDTA